MKKNKKTTELCPQTIADLARSGLTEDDGKAMGIRSLTAKEMYNKFQMLAIGFIIPYGGGYERAKLLENNQDERKYTQAKGSKPEIYFPPLGGVDRYSITEHADKTLYIVEGEKKAAALSKAGYPCVGIGGVWCWRAEKKPLVQWERFNFDGWKVYICFDSDIVDKIGVQQAERALAAFLTEEGAIVQRVRLTDIDDNGGKAGVDDFLVYHGFPDDLDRACAAFDNLPREEIDLSDMVERFTDVGNARRFVRLNRGTLIYVPLLRQWMSFNPKTGTWSADENGQIMRRAKATISTLFADAEKARDMIFSESLEKWAKACESAARLKSMIELSTSELDIVVMPESLDADLWAVATGEGSAIDLRSSLKHEAKASDYFTKSIGTSFNSDAKCPQWENFISEIMGGDNEMITYLQDAVGYSLSGNMSEQCFFVLWGQGANGKSTFLNVLLTLFGQYGCQCSPETFMAKRNEGIRNDIARLHGARFIATSEVEDGHWLAESLIKQWTGGEPIVARLMYKELFQFQPVGKIWLATNHKPRIRSMDTGIWRRIRLIPFSITFKPERQDKNLYGKLLSELPGILNWALRGCSRWNENGLMPPNSVVTATEEYQKEMDVLGMWISEVCEEGEGQDGLIKDLYESYSQWCKNTGHHALSQTEFTRRMKERGYDKKKTTRRSKFPYHGELKGWFFLGIGIREEKSKK